MAQASHSIEVDLPVAAFYGLVTDFEAYPTFLSDVRSARVLARKGHTWDAAFVARVIKDIDYTLRLVGEPPVGVSWTLLESTVMTGNEGSWALEDLGGGRTRATYAVALTLNRLVPAAVTRMLVQSRLPSMLDEWAVRARQVKAQHVRAGQAADAGPRPRKARKGK